MSTQEGHSARRLEGAEGTEKADLPGEVISKHVLKNQRPTVEMRRNHWGRIKLERLPGAGF